MPTLTVIVTADNDTTGLKYTLEGLVEQSTEDFNVLIIDNCCDKPAKEMIAQYCNEYVGFESIETDRISIPEARNLGTEHAKADYLYFIDCCDYISPDSVENILRAAEETKADIICPRYYFSGTNEPAYDSWTDMLAVVPEIDKFDRALLNTLDYDGRVFSRKFFDRGLRYPDTPVLYNTQFIANCLFQYKAKVTGVAGAIYDKKNGLFFDGYAENAEPGKVSFDIYVEVYENIVKEIREIIKSETGSADGDEYTIQEFFTIYFRDLVNYFYRRFWYLTNDEITLLRDKFESISSFLTDERKQKFNEANKDLRFPGMYMSREDAAKMPFFSLILDFNKTENVNNFIRVLYINNFPFFEIFIRESLRDCIPERFSDAENLHICPDNAFFAEARKNAKGIPINVKDTSPLDSRILSEMSLSKAPRTMLQYMFSAKRKKYAAKTYLKNKGLQLA